MTASLAHPPRFRLQERTGRHLRFASGEGFTAHLFVLTESIFRVAILPGAQFSFPLSWAIAPGMDDVAEAGRDRFDTSGFGAMPAYEILESENEIIVAGNRLRVHIDPSGFRCRWEMNTQRGWQEIARDRPTQAYNFGWWGKKPHHYLARRTSERYYGLGDKSGAMNRALRRFRLNNTDAMGYSAKTSDPLYKHIPFYITQDPGSATAFGLFYDTYANCEFDFGAELSNYHGHFRSFVADAGDLDYYVIAGPEPADVVCRFTWLTGRPMLPPKWSLGYSGSTMSYTDAHDAQTRMAEFIDKCRAHDILCDSFHLSSGYTSIGLKRHVFHWNRDKFRDPARFVQSYHAAGIKLIPNIKPCILAENPLFEDARAQRLLVSDAAGEPEWIQFWDGLGAYVDFTNPAARRWWSDHVKSSLLDYGFDATWNDNNEFEIVSPTAVAHGFRGAMPAIDSKPLQTMLMLRSSRDAQRDAAPKRRPFLVTRAGSAGMQRYAQTWSGDNTTSWETLRYNIRMGLSLALSGVSNSGHDVGGFAGPAPDPELFVRWMEQGVFMPRFSIHSWNSDGTVNEPWMHADVTSVVRELIRLRYRLLPYLYDLMWRSHRDFEPVWRPTFYDFPRDPRCFEETDSFMLGANLLVAPVCVPGERTLDVYLPSGCGWVDFWSGTRHRGGDFVHVEAPLGRPVFFVRDCAAIPMNIAEQHFDSRADAPAFAVFAPAQGRIEALCYEDDGESTAWRGGQYGFWHVTIDCRDVLDVSVARTGQRPPPSPTLALLFDRQDLRAIEPQDCEIVSTDAWQHWRKIVLAPKS